MGTEQRPWRSIATIFCIPVLVSGRLTEVGAQAVGFPGNRRIASRLGRSRNIDDWWGGSGTVIRAGTVATYIYPMPWQCRGSWPGPTCSPDHLHLSRTAGASSEGVAPLAIGRCCPPSRATHGNLTSEQLLTLRVARPPWNRLLVAGSFTGPATAELCAREVEVAGDAPTADGWAGGRSACGLVNDRTGGRPRCPGFWVFSLWSRSPRPVLVSHERRVVGFR